MMKTQINNDQIHPSCREPLERIQIFKKKKPTECIDVCIRCKILITVKEIRKKY